MRCRHCEQGRSDGDRKHSKRVATADVLAEVPDGQGEEEDEARPEQRLHEGQRRVGEGEGLQRPAREAERSADDPARSLDESNE
jgi:hypothetical protein